MMETETISTISKELLRSLKTNTIPIDSKFITDKHMVV